MQLISTKQDPSRRLWTLSLSRGPVILRTEYFLPTQPSQQPPSEKALVAGEAGVGGSHSSRHLANVPCSPPERAGGSARRRGAHPWTQLKKITGQQMSSFGASACSARQHHLGIAGAGPGRGAGSGRRAVCERVLSAPATQWTFLTPTLRIQKSSV